MLEIIKIVAVFVGFGLAILISALLLMYRATESGIDGKKRYIVYLVPYVIFFPSFHAPKNRGTVEKINSVLLAMSIILVILGVLYVGLHVDVLV